jgi:transporter family protein
MANPVVLAIITAICWSVGGFFEKKGLKLGNLAPVMGITVRTAVALVVLGAASFSHWSSLAVAGTKPLLYLIIGGGIVAGSLGMLSFYAAIHAGDLSTVLPVAFGLTPMLGFLLGVTLMGEVFTPYKLLGVVLISVGVVVVTLK